MDSHIVDDLEGDRDPISAGPSEKPSMRRINGGGGDDGDPVRSPIGQSL